MTMLLDSSFVQINCFLLPRKLRLYIKKHYGKEVVYNMYVAVKCADTISIRVGVNQSAPRDERRCLCPLTCLKALLQWFIAVSQRMHLLGCRLPT